MSMRLYKAAALAAVLLAATLLAPPPADAHLVQTGFGEFYDGIGHFLVTLPDLFAVIAVALLAGSSGAAAARRALVALPLTWLVAGFAAKSSGVDVVSPWATTLLFGALGALVATDVKCPPLLVAVASALAGLLHGWSDGAGIAEALHESGAASGGTLALFGITAAVFVIVTLLSALVVPLKSDAARWKSYVELAKIEPQ